MPANGGCLTSLDGKSPKTMPPPFICLLKYPVLQWPSYSGADASFWDHEWSKHGTCAIAYSADGLRSIHDYFAQTISLHSSLNIYARFFCVSGVCPGNGSFDGALVLPACILLHPGFLVPAPRPTVNSKLLMSFCFASHTLFLGSAASRSAV